MNNLKLSAANEEIKSSRINILSLVKIDGWVSPKKEYRGNYRNDEGLGLCGFFRKDYKNHSRMYVLNRGNVLNFYNYPNTQIPFTSDMLRWENLYHCGGYGVEKDNGAQVYTQENLFETVLSGLKPMAFLFVREEDTDRFIDRAKDKDLLYTINPHSFEGYCEVAVAQKGRIKDHFNLNDLIESYRIMSRRCGFELLTREEEDYILAKSDSKLSDFIRGFDYGNPVTNVDFVLTGLLLGYPIESTFAILTR